MASSYQWQGDRVLLLVCTQPRASRDEIVGIQDNQLKIRITAPAIDGKAKPLPLPGENLRYLATGGRTT